MTHRSNKIRSANRSESGYARPEYVFLTRAGERLRGLLFRRPDDTVRVLVPCASVHTVGMSHAIDVAFLDGEGTVLSVHRRIGKCQRVRCGTARMTLERFASDRSWFRVGERVRLTAEE